MEMTTGSGLSRRMVFLRHPFREDVVGSIPTISNNL